MSIFLSIFDPKFRDMGFPIVAALGAATAIGGNLIANASNRNEATKQREWNEAMYGRQIADQERFWQMQNDYNLQLWHMQNAYNSPSAQMQRLKDAGLNPHLMYGKGTVGLAGMPQASKLSGSTVQGYQKPQMDSVTKGVNFFSDYMQFKSTNAQVDNVKAETNLKLQESYLKAQQALKNSIDIQNSSFELNRKRWRFKNGEKDLFASQVDAAAANVEKIQAEINNLNSSTGLNVAKTRDTWQATRNRKTQNESEVLRQKEMEQKIKIMTNKARESSYFVKRIEKQLLTMDKSNELKELLISMRSAGLEPSDELYWRFLWRVVGTRLVDLFNQFIK